MTKIACIKNGLVDNIIVADIGFAAGLGYDAVIDVSDSASVSIGAAYANGVFSAAPAAIIADPCASLIDIGPFFDRFGVAKMPVLVSADPVVKAIIADVMVRKWVDLTRPDVAQALNVIGSKVAELSPAIKTTILALPVLPEENMAVRKLYFS